MTAPDVDPATAAPEAAEACGELIRLWALGEKHGLDTACALLFGGGARGLHPACCEALIRLGSIVEACRAERMAAGARR